jgi:hypothetical protein
MSGKKESSPVSSPVMYRGYAVYSRHGDAIWKTCEASGHEYVADHKPRKDFRIVRVDPALPPVLSARHPGSLASAFRDVDFLLKFGTSEVPGEVRL